MGWGISSLVAELLQMRLAVMGRKSMVMRRGSLSLWEQARSAGEGDVLVVCELPSYSVEVTESVEIASRNGAKVFQGEMVELWFKKGAYDAQNASEFKAQVLCRNHQ